MIFGKRLLERAVRIGKHTCIWESTQKYSLRGSLETTALECGEVRLTLYVCFLCGPFGPKGKSCRLHPILLSFSVLEIGAKTCVKFCVNQLSLPHSQIRVPNACFSPRECDLITAVSYTKKPYAEEHCGCSSSPID